MLLHRIHIDARCREARRDLADPYQLHSTLCRAFSQAEAKCPAGSVLWRLEPETDREGNPRVLVQSRAPADWGRIAVRGWLAAVDPAIDIGSRLGFDALLPGHAFRFRLRANPCVTRNGKRLGLMRLPEQQAWLARKGTLHGFTIAAAESLDTGTPVENATARISHEQMLTGRQHSGNRIRIYSVLYDGILTVIEPAMFVDGLRSGIGHGKALGLGLLSLAPAR